ncbi:MAG: hypothetical protein HY001_02765 [Candidatus Portnoybacteria bacterium]|nr:hypothetical protein [Candidatus Portnoybacteria bacterium]
MKSKKAYLFITHHPDQLSLYKSLATIIRAWSKNDPVVLIKVNHPYYKTFNFTPYRQYFDSVIEFPFVYEKNILRGIRELALFKTQLEKIEAYLAPFQSIDVFLSHSAWLPINILLYRISKWKHIDRIYRFLLLSPSFLSSQRYDARRTLFYKLYSLLGNLFSLKQYKVKALKSREGKEFVGFLYTQDIPGIAVRIVNPAQRPMPPMNKGEIVLPYPLVKERRPSLPKKDTLVVFGDAGILASYPEYVDDYREAVKKLTTFFRHFENYYADYKLYYKPHPMDKAGELIPGINPKKYRFFDNTVNAQLILDSYHERIGAVYTFSSTSAIWGSFFGIPSYTIYRYIYNEFGIARFNTLFAQEGVSSKLIFHISRLDQIGKKDKVKIPLRYIDLKNMDRRYRALFHKL